MSEIDLLVIGAGPAGLMAAIKAADEGLKVCIIESMPLPARKLGISGKGRGNLTNTAKLKDFLSHFNNHGRFLKTAFASFFNTDLIEFFTKEGLETIEERGGRIFTSSGKATDASKCLHRAIEKRRIRILFSSSAKGLIISDKACVGAVLKNGQKISAKRTLLATGGLSYPRTGSTGDGIEIARMTGHDIKTPLPSLVALKPEADIPDYLNGTTLRNISAELRINGKKVAMENGEMQFIDGYLGGPVIITLSRKAVSAINFMQNVEIILDIKPALEYEQLDKRIQRDCQQKPKVSLKEILNGLMPVAMQKYCLSQNRLSPDIPVCRLGSDQRKTIRNWLKQQTFKIINHAGWEQAIVTAGGVDCSQINPVTLESKIVPNLYFAGEIIDIDADTGGYNLQAAFSTGWLAGREISKTVNKPRKQSQ